MKTLITFTFFISLSLQIIAAKKLPGYVILSNGDTLKGFIKRPGFLDDKQNYTFYDSNDKKQILVPADLIGYGCVEDNEQKDYIKFKTGRLFGSDRFEFLQRIITGKLSVYEYFYYYNATQKGSNYYLEAQDGKVYVIDFNRISGKKDLLKEALADCASVVENMTGILTHKKILKFVTEYNNCNVSIR